jgi:hypothetical protein
MLIFALSIALLCKHNAKIMQRLEFVKSILFFRKFLRQIEIFLLQHTGGDSADIFNRITPLYKPIDERILR